MIQIRTKIIPLRIQIRNMNENVGNGSLNLIRSIKDPPPPPPRYEIETKMQAAV